MIPTDPWDLLARNLQSRYGPVLGRELFDSYADGANRDLRRWRAIGGVEEVPAPAKPARTTNLNALRDARIAAAAKTGTSLDLIAERFRISKQTVALVLGRVGLKAVK